MVSLKEILHLVRITEDKKQGDENETEELVSSPSIKEALEAPKTLDCICFMAKLYKFKKTTNCSKKLQIKITDFTPFNGNSL